MEHPPHKDDMYWCTECPGLWSDANHRCEQWSSTKRVPKKIIDLLRTTKRKRKNS